jgi:hypothetical protein
MGLRVGTKPAAYQVREVIWDWSFFGVTSVERMRNL